MMDLLIKAKKYTNAEDALAAIKVGEPRTSKPSSQDNLKGQKRERKDHSSENEKAQKMINFTPLVMPIYQILV